MQISYDPVKRAKTLAERGLDFDWTPSIFMGEQYTFEDRRYDYGETRKITIGYLNQRMMVVVWTPREEVRHIISMRKANDREKNDYQEATQKTVD